MDKIKATHTKLCQINAVNRQLAINEDANHLRSLGDVFVTGPKNASKLIRRTKETARNSKGKFHKKKRFGKSIKNRCLRDSRLSLRRNLGFLVEPI